MSYNLKTVALHQIQGYINWHVEQGLDCIQVLVLAHNLNNPDIVQRIVEGQILFNIGSSGVTHFEMNEDNMTFDTIVDSVPTRLIVPLTNVAGFVLPEMGFAPIIHATPYEVYTEGDEILIGPAREKERKPHLFLVK